MLLDTLPGLRLLKSYRLDWLRGDVVAGVVRAGSLVSFISETVMTGFKTGVALHLASTQLPKLLGFKGSHGDFWERMGHVLSRLGETNPTSLALGGAALLLLILGKWLLPNRPVSLLVLVAGIAAVPLFGLADRGVALLGEVPQGLPVPGLPALHPSDANVLLPLAMACFLLGAVETAAIGRTFARKHGYRLDSNQEFLALSAANLAAGLGRGFPVSGGMSQSLVNEGGGARTPLSGLVAAGIMAVVALFLAGLLRDLPQPVLAAIVLMAVSGLFKLSELRRLWRPGVDLAGAELLEELHHALREGGIAFRLAEARGEVRDTLRAAGFEGRCSPVVPIQPVATVIAEWREDDQRPGEAKQW